MGAVCVCVALGVPCLWAGDETCQRCHAAETSAFRKTGMGASITPADPKEFLTPFAIASPNGTTYRTAVRDGQPYQESVRAGEVLESHAIRFAIGSGNHGKSYVLARGQSLFMAPLSYYSAKSGWDLSPGYAAGLYRDFLRPVTVSCLLCHSGNPAGSGASPIGCEQCHGPGEAHSANPASRIVNPAKLAGMARDDVCAQCHLAGDIRVLRPGRKETDFQPGAALADTVAVFSLPISAKPDGIDAVGHVAQLRASRCFNASAGRLGCVTCHNPHAERRGPQAVAFYKARCLTCHGPKACTASSRQRASTTPADNCIECHMPKSDLNRIAHIAHTNHRIPRRPEEALDPSLEANRAMDLKYESGRVGDARSRALAYTEAARGLPAFSGRALHLVQDALADNPRDAELTAALGFLRRDPALLEKAVESGSTSADVRIALCEWTAREDACRTAIQQSPYDPRAYVELVRIYARTGDAKRAAEITERLRAFDPGNPELAARERTR
jgi:hypothetical protein